MKVDLFDYDLPASFIANEPARPRDSARLLDLTGDGFVDRVVRDLPDLLRAGDILVSNDTRVIPARIGGHRDQVRIEATLHKPSGGGVWAAFARPGKRLRVGDTITFDGGLTANVAEKREGGEIILAFQASDGEIIAHLKRHGHMPLPPYIKRSGTQSEDTTDGRDYQTIFAKREGAVAAPTAGLHFTPEMLARLDEKGVRRVTVTLHVGAGTFLPVKVEDTDDHVMHGEWGEIDAANAETINQARAAGGRLIAVGTTSLRLLESAAGEDGQLRPFSDETRLFISPGYRFKAVDLLLTNFHLPRSTLLMLVSAFSGRERMLAAYEHAKQAGYRFFSYGDACLLRQRNLETDG